MKKTVKTRVIELTKAERQMVLDALDILSPNSDKACKLKDLLLHKVMSASDSKEFKKWGY